jgi:hypothetical protein
LYLKRDGVDREKSCGRNVIFDIEGLLILYYDGKLFLDADRGEEKS